VWAARFPAHVMVGQPVQFVFAPAETTSPALLRPPPLQSPSILGDSCRVMGRRPYRLRDAANSTWAGFFYSTVGRITKNCRTLAGFRRLSALQMNGGQTKTRQKPNRSNLTKEIKEVSNEKMKKACAVLLAVLSFPCCAAAFAARTPTNTTRALAEHCRQYHRFP